MNSVKYLLEGYSIFKIYDIIIIPFLANSTKKISQREEIRFSKANLYLESNSIFLATFFVILGLWKTINKNKNISFIVICWFGFTNFGKLFQFTTVKHAYKN